MNHNLNSDVVGVANVQPLFDCPPWLRLRLDPTLSLGGRELCETLLRAVALVLRHAPPRHAMVRCDVVTGAFSIMFASAPRCGDIEHAVLTNIAARFGELYNRRFAAGLREPAVAKELPDLDIDPCDREIDIVGLVKRRSRSTSIDMFKFAQDAEQLEQRIKGRDKESRHRIAETIERLAASGFSRRVAAPPADWSARLDRMVATYPNFVTVIETVIRPHVSLCAMGLPHRLAPILLVGDPGIGKTRFSNALAGLLGVPPPLFLSIATESNASSISGSSTFWSNSSPGQLFESVAWGSGGHAPVANGLVILDEVDKSNAGPYDPLGPLYSLLEEHTARNFVDQSLPDVLFDASHLRVIATANIAENIPAPLRSRMLTFEIAQPSPDQLIVIAQEIVEEMVRKMDLQFSTTLPERFARDILGTSPRAIKLSLEIAFARAVVAQRDHFVAEDWPSVQTDTLSSRRKHSMGFVSN